MSEIERRQSGELDVPITADWYVVKREMRDRFQMEMRVSTGRAMSMRSMDALDEMQDHIQNRPSALKAHIMTAFGMSAAELINRYMTGE